MSSEHRLGMFGNKVLRRTTAHTMQKLTAGWRKLHNGTSSLAFIIICYNIIKLCCGK
jgi:hypothetical protein